MVLSFGDLSLKTKKTFNSKIMKLRLQTFSYRFAEQVLNSRLSIKQEVESILNHSSIKIPDLTRPYFNEILDNLFKKHG